MIDPDDQMKESQPKTWDEVVKIYNAYFANTENRLKKLERFRELMETWAGAGFREWLARQEK